MNLKEFREALQITEGQETLCVMNLNQASNDVPANAWGQRFLVGENLPYIAQGIAFNDSVLMTHSWNGDCYIMRKTRQTWEIDEEKIESIIQFEVYCDSRPRNDRSWNERGTDGLREINQVLNRLGEAFATYAVRVRGLMFKLVPPRITIVSNSYNSMDYPTVSTNSGRLTEINIASKEGNIGSVYQTPHYLVQVLNNPSEDLSSNFSHSSVLLKEEDYTDWIPELMPGKVIEMPGSCIVRQVDEEPKVIVGDTLIEMIDDCRLNISTTSQLSIEGSNYKLNRGVYFLTPAKDTMADLRAYERWLVEYSSTIEFRQIRNKTSYLKKMDDVTGNSAQKSSKSLNTLDSIENGVTPAMGSGRITKM
jgi:hypothetical protein